MDYEVVFVGDDELAGKDWAIVRIGGKFIAFLKESRITPQVLMEAWRAFASFMGFDPDVPAPRWGTIPHSWMPAPRLATV
jgi:hypothetical protein